MSEPKPQFIANLILKESRNTVFRNLRDVVFDVIVAKGCISSEEATWDYIDQYVEDIANELFVKEGEYNERGIQKPFEIEGDVSTYHFKYLSPEYNDIFDSLMSLSPIQFEHFCADVVSHFGGQGIPTGGTADEGIDFIGKDLLLSGIKVSGILSTKVSLLGQAKHYCDGHQVTLKEVREFLGAAVKYRDKLIRDNIKIFQPFIFAFWTTSDFHSEAIAFFQSMGIWYLNGLQLSSLAFSLGYTAEKIQAKWPKM